MLLREVLCIFLISQSIFADENENFRKDCKCGQSSVRFSGRIVNGKKVKPHLYPWMVAQYLETSKGYQLNCGGAIISDKNILTAAHCVFHIPQGIPLYWVAGMHYSKLQDGEKYYIENSELHPKFTNYSAYDDYDMALLTTTERIKFNDKIAPICLPYIFENYEGKNVIVAGWGRTHDSGSNKDMATELLQTRVQIYPTPTCDKVFRRALINYNTNSMFCGFRRNTDACQGDSGGPIFTEKSFNRFVILGVISFGSGCAGELPGVYGRLAEAETSQWIKDYMNKTGGVTCH